MPKREAPSRIVPLVFAEDGGGHAVAAKCCLCGKRIVQRDLCYGRLAADPAGPTCPLHIRCKREFELYVQALSL